MNGQSFVNRRKTAAAYGVATVLCLLILVWTLKLWQADLRVPLTYYGEGKFNALLVKTVLDFGWHLDNPAMGMPSGLDLRDVPMSDNNFHFLLIKLIGLFTKNYGLALNLFFLLTFPLTTLSALFVLRRFNISYAPAIFASLIYTFLPFHFIRGQHHLFLSAYFFVPLMVMVVLWVATGEVSLVDEESGKFRLKWRDPKLIASLVICLLMAASGTYYAYFGCIFLLVSGCLIALRRRNARWLLLPCALIAIISGFLVINLMPSILYLRQNGETPIVRRHVIDAETYSLRISQLVLPVLGHRLYLMAKLKAAFNQRIFINENDDASLGIIGSIGFLTLLGWLLLKKPELKHIEEDDTNGVISHLSILNLIAVLLGTFGGFSALIALLVTTKIRAYNRISIYIAFFSLFAIALLLDRFARPYLRSRGRRIAFNSCLAVALVLGVLDQAAPRFVPEYAKIKTEFQSDANFMGKLQSSLPQGAMIFQLPFVPFPENPKVGKMFDYDHARGYLHSTGLRWSYGAMKGRDSEVWQKLISSKPTSEMIETIVLSGFQGLYLNRNGYQERPSKVETEVEAMLGKPQFVSEDEKLVFFDLRDIEKQMSAKYPGSEWQAKREAALHPVLLVWSNGCSDLEGSTDNNFRWCSSIGELQVTNGASKPRQVKLEMSVASENNANLWINSPLLTDHLDIGPNAIPFAKAVVIPPGRHTINFTSDARRVLAPGDFRYLVFKINNFKMTVEN